jgi:hypothetical protein
LIIDFRSISAIAYSIPGKTAYYKESRVYRVLLTVKKRKKTPGEGENSRGKPKRKGGIGSSINPSI